MAFVTIKRAEKTIRVSRSAYENQYKRLGYRIVGDDAKQKRQEYKTPELEKITDAEVIESEDELEEIPVSDMNKAQLAEYARKNNIDTSAARSVNEARKIIQKAIQERSMQ